MVDISQLKVLQDDLKDLSEQNYQNLKQQILRLGFSEPVTVWIENGTHWLLNGTQRFRTLTKMRQDGIEVPEIPCVYVEAKDKNEAKRKILSLTSQYGEITGDGLYKFLQGTDLTSKDLGEFRFPEIDIPKFLIEFYTDEKPAEKEKKLKKCPSCGFEY